MPVLHRSLSLGILFPWKWKMHKLAFLSPDFPNAWLWKVIDVGILFCFCPCSNNLNIFCFKKNLSLFGAAARVTQIQISKITFARWHQQAQDAAYNKMLKMLDPWIWFASMRFLIWLCCPSFPHILQLNTIGQDFFCLLATVSPIWCSIEQNAQSCKFQI